MRIVMVGEKDGRNVVRWPQCLGLGLALSTIVGYGAGVVFFLLAGRWSHFPVLFGSAVAIGTVGVGLVAGLRTPPDTPAVCEPVFGRDHVDS